jgi:transglutaminase-like putative cysteine protease/predicted glutamine amidotransferase
MSQLLAMSFDSAASPSIKLRPWEADAAPSGWGFGWYPQGEFGAAVVKDPMPTGDTAMSKLLRDWERFRGTNFICHIRGAAKRSSQQDTHPFSRSYAGRDWLLAHGGQLDPQAVRALPLGAPPVFEPVGRTDSEYAFCWLLTQIRASGARRIDEIGFGPLLSLLRELDGLGSINLLFSDGHNIVAYCDEDESRPLYFARRTPPYEQYILENDAVKVDLSDPLDINRTMVLIASRPLGGGDEWESLAPGELLVVRRGAIIYRSSKPTEKQRKQFQRQEAAVHELSSLQSGELSTYHETPDVRVNNINAPTLSGPIKPPTQPQPQQAAMITPPSPTPTGADREDEGEQLMPIKTSGLVASPTGMARLNTTAFRGDRILTVLHETTYRYQEAVERSTHIFRLRPVHDLGQQVLDFELSVDPPGQSHSYEDVFGNQAMRVKLRNPYDQLTISTRSRVRIVEQSGSSGSRKRFTLPLIWMPWQRQMMLPYLLPPELPESQLRELSEFAMSFAERQDFDLMETLADINATIFHDFAYAPASTTLATTPFDVYVNRHGVCQDFANLFICLSRLLGVPARYRVGYIHTGADYENKLQSEASHAWLELYLPWVGWRGFDPTNGCLANQDHVRVAAGRNYRDATPTSGTIFKGGKGETLKVNVQVKVE